MYKLFKIGKLNISMTLRHRWDSKSKKSFDLDFRKWELGLWFKRDKMVGAKDFKNSSKWSDNMVGSYTVGFNLLVIKTWISWDWGGKHIKIK